MKIIKSDKPIIKCEEFTLIMPYSRFGTISSQAVRDNYTIADQFIRSSINSTEDPEGNIFIAKDQGNPSINYLEIVGIVVLDYAHEKCKDIKVFEHCLYNIQKQFATKHSLGIFDLENWVEEKYIPLFYELIEKYLGSKVTNLKVYK